MYEFLRTVIENRNYSDLNAITAKVDKAWAYGTITDEQRSALRELLLAADPCADVDIKDEIRRLWAAVHAMERRPAAAAQEEPGEAVEEAKPWQQPTGAHDAYNTGDRIEFGGVIYESLIDGNVRAPDVYLAGWKEV